MISQGQDTRLRYGLPALLVGSLMVAACGSSPLPTTYTLPQIEPPQPLATPALDGVLMVERPSAESALATVQVAWRAADDPYVIQYHETAEWSDTPARLVQNRLRGCLEAGRAADAVIQPTERTLASYLLGGSLIAMEQVVSADETATFHIAADLALTRARDRRRLWAEQFKVIVSAADASPEAAIAAADRALVRLCSDILTALAARE